MKTARKTLNYPSILFILLISSCFIFFAFFYQYHLHFKEQMQLFQLTSEYFRGYFNKPAAIASFLGDFFTQFYYLKFGGSIVITCCLGVLWWLLNIFIYRFSTSRWVFILSLLIILLVALFHCNIQYSLTSTIALILAVSFTLAYTYLKSPVIRLFLGIIAIPLSYFFSGGFFFFYIVGIIIYEWKVLQKKIVLLSYSVALLGLSVFLPFAFRPYYNLTISQVYTYPIEHKFAPFPNFQLEKLLSLDCEWYFNHPEKTLKLAQKYNLKNRYASYYYNLAIVATHRMPGELMNGYQPGSEGLFISLNKEQSYITVTFSNEIYFYLGDVNASHHCALLGMTFSPKSQSSRLMRRLVEINVINGEYAVAEKYIKMLEQTWFHRKWAKEMRKYLYDEAKCNKDQWIAYKRSQIPTNDYIKDNPNDFEGTVCHLTENHPENIIVKNYFLCYYLLNKDLTSFFNKMMKEISNKRIGEISELYQEALLIYFAQNINNRAKDSVHFSPEVINRFIGYTNKYAENKGNGELLHTDYGKTYWFYYHYATFKSEYKQ